MAEAAELQEVSLEGKVESAMLRMKRMRMRAKLERTEDIEADTVEGKRTVTWWGGLAEAGELLEVGGVQGNVESAM